MKHIKSCTILIIIIGLLLAFSTILFSAGNIKKTWASPVVLAETDGYGGAVPDLAADEAYDYTSAIDLETNGYEGIHLTLEYDASGTTDDIIFSIFGSLDGSNYDDIELTGTTCDNDSGADTQVTFIIKDLAQLRIGLKTSGTTDTFDYQITYQPWRWYYE